MSRLPLRLAAVLTASVAFVSSAHAVTTYVTNYSGTPTTTIKWDDVPVLHALPSDAIVAIAGSSYYSWNAEILWTAPDGKTYDSKYLYDHPTLVATMYDQNSLVDWAVARVPGNWTVEVLGYSVNTMQQGTVYDVPSSSSSTFTVLSAVPEPATHAMWISGLAMMIAISARRQADAPAQV